MNKEEQLKQLNRQLKSYKYVDFTNTQRLGKFLKNVRTALRIVRKIKEEETEEIQNLVKVSRVRLVEKTSIAPGTILIFNYNDADGRASIRKVLAVTCGRTGNGTYFNSTQDNDLLTAYDLNNVTADLLSEILERLEGNTAACTYQANPAELKDIVPDLKENEFRTYNLKSMTGVNSLNIIKRS